MVRGELTVNKVHGGNSLNMWNISMKKALYCLHTENAASIVIGQEHFSKDGTDQRFSISITASLNCMLA